MFGSSILDVAIGLMFVYLLLSLICSAVNEGYSSVVKKRGRMLLRGIKSLLDDPALTGLAGQFYCHGLIEGISNKPVLGKSPGPSYIPSKSFALAILDILKTRGAVSALPAEAEEVLEALRTQLASGLAVNADVASAETLVVSMIDKLKFEAAAANTIAQTAETSSSRDDQSLMEASKNARKIANSANAMTREFSARLAALRANHANNDGSLRINANIAWKEARIAGQIIAASTGETLGHIQAAIMSLPRGHPKEALQALLDKALREGKDASQQVSAFQQEVEAWFNEAMTRVGGWYKRWSQGVLLATSVIVVCALNADTFNLVQRLMVDEALRASLVVAANDTVRDGSPAGLGSQDTANDGNSNSGLGLGKDSQAGRLLAEAERLNIPLGWSAEPKGRWTCGSSTGCSLGSLFLLVVTKFFGLAMTVAAISLGAPFWFDMLSKVSNIRGTGKPPSEQAK